MVSSKLKWWLGLSLVLNLFLITGVGAAFYVVHTHMPDFHRPMPPVEAWRDATSSLTPAERQRIYSVIRIAALSGEPDMEKAREIRASAAVLATKEPYDVAKIIDLSAQARAAENDARIRVENALIQGMAELPPNERGTVASQLLRPSFRFHYFTMKNPPLSGGPNPAASSASSN